MKKFRIAGLFLLLFSSLQSFGQANQPAEMADILRQDGKIYTVVFGIVIILTAVIFLLIRIDRKVFKLEKQIKK